MMYMITFWVLMLASFVLHRIKQRHEWVKDWDVIAFLLGASSLAGAILTRDPIFSSFGVPLEFEWVVGVAVTVIGLWKTYFRPLNNRLVKTEKEVGVLGARINAVENELDVMRSDLHIVKEKLMFSP